MNSPRLLTFFILFLSFLSFYFSSSGVGRPKDNRVKMGGGGG